MLKKSRPVSSFSTVEDREELKAREVEGGLGRMSLLMDFACSMRGCAVPIA